MSSGSLTDLLLRSARAPEPGDPAGMRTVILAGGKGTRLKPYTSVLPKPLMPLGNRAILEVVLHQLAHQGFTDVTLSVGYLAHLIEAVFGDGSEHGVKLAYVREDAPLGTAGSLRLVPGLDDAFLMLNGDLVTTFDFRELVRAHRASDNLLTIATRKRRVGVDYGVLRVEHDEDAGNRVAAYTEKPTLDVTVSMGIYVVEPAALRFIPPEGHFDFPELVRSLLDAGEPVGAFEHDGLWLDIGRQEDYERAIALLEEGKLAGLDDDGGASPEAAGSNGAAGGTLDAAGLLPGYTL